MAYILELQKRNNNRFFQCGCLLSLSVDQILTTLKKDRILKENQNSGRRRRKGDGMMNLHGLSSMNWGQNPSFFLSVYFHILLSDWLICLDLVWIQLQQRSMISLWIYSVSWRILFIILLLFCFPQFSTFSYYCKDEFKLFLLLLL